MSEPRRESTARPLVIYHGACRDGFCAAWVLRKVFPHAEFFEGFYGQAPPDVTGRPVVLVDFSYPRPILEDMADKCFRLTVLDHHKTAQEALEGFQRPNVTVVFDMNRSGAGIAWDHYFSSNDRPWLVSYIEDRDLWKFQLFKSREANAYISILALDFQVWDEEEFITSSAFEYGPCILAKTEQYVREVVKNARRVNFHGHDVPLVNAPQVDISEVLDKLRDGEKFAIGWWQRADGVYQYSLRSAGDFDVATLAKEHGGGGHKNAAGFQLPGFIFG